MKGFKMLVLCAAVSLVMGGCSKQNEVQVEGTSQTEQTDSTETDNQNNNEIVNSNKDRKEKDGSIESYLTGEWVDKKIGNRRPVAIMLNNLQVACPQTGISKYGVIYEAPVEGAITRLMAIFENYDDLEKIGSVRSCRDYFIYYMLEFDAIYCHYGQAVYAEELLEEDFVDNLNGLEGVGATVYYRSVDRKQPHNVYASADGIKKGIEQKGYSLSYSEDYTGHYNFAEEGQKPDMKNGYDAKIVKPGYLINKPWFEYNDEDGLYYRFQYGSKQIDDMNNEQLTCKNIILQYTAWCNYDDHGYLSLNAIGGGKGVYITDGKAIDIEWSKPTPYGPAVYTDLDGNEIEINRGQTWVCVIQDTYAENVNISSK